MFKIELPNIAQDSFEYLLNDFELLKEMFGDDIILYNKKIKNSETKENENEKEENSDKKELLFLIKIKNEIDIPESTFELIKSMELNDLLSSENTFFLPYWLKFYYDEINEKLIISFFIYWIKNKPDFIENIKSKFNSLEEPYLFNSIDNIKELLTDSIKKEELVNLFTEIKFNNISAYSKNPINILMDLTGASEGLEDFEYESKLNKNNGEIINSNDNNNNNSKIDETSDTKNEEKTIESNNKNNEESEKNYHKFFKKGGKIGEPLMDRTNLFQAHGIKIYNDKDYTTYKGWILNQHKIKNATHNIVAYRYFDEEKKTIIEDFDDGGQHGAGIRVLGIMQKMNIVNIFICVSRWDGGKHIGHDKYKRIDDRAANLINSYLTYFKSK